MRVVRWLLGSLILLFNRLFAPRGVKRSVDSQARIDAQTAGLIL